MLKLNKSLALILALALALSVMAGCGGNPPVSNDGSQSESQSQSQSESKSEPQAPAGYTPGVWEGNVYTSAFLKMKYTLPEGWTSKTAEELLEQAESDGNPPTEKQRQGDFSDAEAIYELSVFDGEESALMTMMVMNLSLNPINRLVDEEDMFAGMKEGLTQEFGDVDVAAGDVFDHTVGGKDFRVLPISFANGVMTQWNAICFEGDYLYMITLVTIGDAVKPADVLSGFEALV